jgi:hypothetical protein
VGSGRAFDRVEHELPRYLPLVRQPRTDDGPFQDNDRSLLLDSLVKYIPHVQSTCFNMLLASYHRARVHALCALAGRPRCRLCARRVSAANDNISI